MSLPTRDHAVKTLNEYLKGAYVLRHSRATEAIMRVMSVRLGADADLWGITGLLHDLDLELVGEDQLRHARETVRILEELYDFPAEGLNAILAHNGDVLGIPCVTAFDHALTSCESITGMVFATALVLPSKKLVDVSAKSVAKRIKEPRFAAKVSRERLSHHEFLGIDRVEFCEIAVDAMRSIAYVLE